MTAYEIFMTLAHDHCRYFDKAMHSDTMMGAQLATENALTALAQLPELAKERKVREIIQSIEHGDRAMVRG